MAQVVTVVVRSATVLPVVRWNTTGVFAPVAQRIEYRFPKLGVAGSIPARGAQTGETFPRSFCWLDDWLK